MRVTKNTKISRILREDIDAIDTIASINRHFKKLKNPMLRKVLAPRVTVKDAAKIGNISVNEFLKKLASIGFEVEYTEQENTTDNLKTQKRNIDTSKITELDVRATVNEGNDPFSEITKALKVLHKEETLKLINVFEPTPLIQIFEEKGYEIWTDTISNEEYHTYFYKKTDSTSEEITKDLPFLEGSFDEKLLSYGENLIEIDVRLLEMPEPMVNILKEVDSMPENHILLVHHKKVPQFLLPELKTRGFTWMQKEIGARATDLLIFKK